MKKVYGNRLRKNKMLPEENQERFENLYSLSHYINNGKKLNSYLENNKLEEKNRESNEILNFQAYSYNKSDSYFSNYPKSKSKNNKNFNNHSLFDSNKQKIINPENNHNYVQFISNNKKTHKNYINLNSNKIPLCTLRNIQLPTIKKRYMNEYHKKIKQEDKYEKKINTIKYNSRNHAIHKDNITDTNQKISYINNEQNSLANYTKNKSLSLNKAINLNKFNKYIKNPSIQYRNKNNNINTNHIYIYTPNQSKYKNNGKNHFKISFPNYKYLTENNSQEKNPKCKQNSNNNTIANRENGPASFMKIKINNTPDNHNKRNKEYILEPNGNKTSKNINSNIRDEKIKAIMPIKLNIECINKEKLSRIKRIIEKSSTYHNFYQIEFPRNKVVSEEKKNKELEEEKNNNNLIFKKKKIEVLDRENMNKHYKNNFLVTSPINNIKNKQNIMISNNKIKDNNQIQSLVSTYNLYINNENKKIRKNNENIISTKETEQNSFLNLNKEKTFKKKKVNRKKNITDLVDNNNDEDTMSLSYSKERNISIFSDRKKNEEISISLPFLMDHFNIQYNIYNKKLIINDNKKNNEKGSKKNSINFDSEDDDYQLTKEIILLKKGLAKKSEPSEEIKRKLRVIIPERIFNLTLAGNKGIYRRKRSAYRNHRL